MQINTNKTLSALLTTIFVFALILSAHDTAQAGWYLDNSGELRNEVDGLVLGEDDVALSSSNLTSTDTTTPTSNTTDNDDNKNNLEYEYRTGNIQYKIERRGSQLTIKKEADGEDSFEYESEAIFEIDEHKSKTRIKISTGSGDYLYFTRGNSAARTDFPLSINPDTNELIVTTSAGTKVVAVLPDQAVANMLAANVLDDINDPSDDDLPSSEVEDVQDSLELDERDGELIYKVDGTSNQKILGLFKVKIRRQAIVSAETGELLDVERTFFQALLDLVSF